MFLVMLPLWIAGRMSSGLCRPNGFIGFQIYKDGVGVTVLCL